MPEGRQRGLDYSSPASMKAEQRAALRGGAGITPGPLENLGAHYYIGNTKIATMFVSHGASGKRQWAALGDWTSWSDGQMAKTAGRAVERTEPDVHLIKQVEQVTTSALEGPTWRLARI